MKTVPVNAERSYQVEIGVDWQIALNDWTEGRKKVVIIKSDALKIQTNFATIDIPDARPANHQRFYLQFGRD